MIGLDTNVLIRYIVQDDPNQSHQATKFIEENLSKDVTGWISHIVLCEIVWVLKRAYGYKKAILVNVIKQLLMTTELDIENPDVAWQALHEYEKGSAGFCRLFNRLLQIKRTDVSIR